MDENNGCNYKNGTLPDCARLAMAYVPMQQSAKPMYNTAQAFSTGTLFPGLDLPFMNMINAGDLTGTPLGEVMALDFAAHELALYLDTHSGDEEAFELYKNILSLAHTAKDKYVKLYGPLTKQDMSLSKSYTWLKNPWPWDYCGKAEE